MERQVFMSNDEMMKIELISEECRECPRLELETQDRMGTKNHRCKNLTMCREILGFWKNKSRINFLEITEYKEDQQ